MNSGSAFVAPARKCVLFSGTVQGVGFRWTTQRIAKDFAVSGLVRNLPDGRVEVVAEGEATQVDMFLSAVRERMADYIRNVVERDESPTGKESGFRIAF